MPMVGCVCLPDVHCISVSNEWMATALEIGAYRTRTIVSKPCHAMQPLPGLGALPIPQYRGGLWAANGHAQLGP
jgi:hypothetical protein